MIRLLIADDHRLFIEGMKLLVQSEADLLCVGEAANGVEALQFLEKNPVEVVLLDIDMPVMNGMEACLEIKKRFPKVKILALTMYNQPSIIRQIMKNGASGYILKNTSKEELLDAIHAVMRGDIFLSRKASDSLVNEFTQPQTTAFIPEITNREKEVLQLIVDGCTTPEIAQRLFISPNTAETHRRNLLAKLGVRNTAELVRLTLEKGLLS